MIGANTPLAASDIFAAIHNADAIVIRALAGRNRILARRKNDKQQR